MKWLMLLLGIVLGAAMTWLLTVKRVTRTLGPDADGGASAPGDVVEDEAAGFGGSATTASSSAMGWDGTAQDEDALFPHDQPVPSPERDIDAGAEPPANVPPIAEATPNGDLAGVSAPRVPSEPAAAPVNEGPTLDARGPDQDSPMDEDVDEDGDATAPQSE